VSVPDPKSSDDELGGQDSFQPGAYKPGTPPSRQAQVFAVEPEHPQSSKVLKIFIVLLLLVGAYGGYYGYCRSKAGDREHTLWEEAQDLYNALMRTEKKIDEEDVREVALEMVSKAGVKLEEDSLEIIIEPLTKENESKLSSTAQLGMSMVAKMPGAKKKPQWLVGFKGRFTSKHSFVTHRFEMERYTWFEWVDESALEEGDDEEEGGEDDY
jgi:hypothetical protein